MAVYNIQASQEAYALSGNKTTWAAAQGAVSAGSFTEFSSATDRDDAVRIIFSTGGRGDIYSINRTFLTWDISSVTGTISSIDLKIPNNSVGAVDADVIVVASTAFESGGYPSSFVSADFKSWNPSSPTAFSGQVSTWIVGTNTITLNATAISTANAQNYLTVGVVEYDFDYLDTDPGGGSNIDISVGMRFANSSNPIELVITDDASGVDFTSVNNISNILLGSVNNVAFSSIAKINEI
jgi:hypothetical protein